MMKKRILSVVILAFMLISVFALVSCGKNEEEKTPCPVSECTGVLVSGESGILYCNQNTAHSYMLCLNEDCGEAIGKDADFCPNCGASQEVCEECSDGEVDGVYCSKCGRQVQKSGKMKFKLDLGALGESAMILCKGMLGIFIVTGVIIAFILILNTVVEKVKESKENKE